MAHQSNKHVIHGDGGGRQPHHVNMQRHNYTQPINNPLTPLNPATSGTVKKYQKTSTFTMEINSELRGHLGARGGSTRLGRLAHGRLGVA